MRRTLELLGYEVRHVMNITDVGHMTEDDVADGEGEDKMEAASRRLLEAKKSGKLPADAADVDPGDPYAIADFYAHAFLEDARTLGLKVAREVEHDPALMPRPTQYIPPDDRDDRGSPPGRSRLRRRRRRGVLRRSVLPRLRPALGQHARPRSARARAVASIEATQAIKRHPADFMLWKPDPTHLMRWPSPWGEGYPGWHLECSVMAHATGSATDTNGVIDIHSGGEDNIFPHHECEIAQACGASGEPFFARYWFHTRFLIVEGEKMSKSKGNFFTVRRPARRGRDAGGDPASSSSRPTTAARPTSRCRASPTLSGRSSAGCGSRDWLASSTAIARCPSPAAGRSPQRCRAFTRALCARPQRLGRDRRPQPGGERRTA